MRPSTTMVLPLLLLAVACGRSRDAATRRTPADAKAMAERPMPLNAAAAGLPEALPPSAEATATADAPPASMVPTVGLDAASPAMIIRTGRASIAIDSLARGLAAVRVLAVRLGGYVANASVEEGRDRPHSGTLEMKVPAERFDDALAALEPIGTLESVNVSAEDVGEEFVDVTARADNARRLEQRLLGLLATRTGKLPDVLRVERELARVRGEIERMEGRLRFLRAHAAMSTLTVTVHEPYPVVGDLGSASVLAEAWRRAWRNFVGLVASVIAALGVVLPLGLAVAAGVALALRRRRARIRRAAPAAS